MGCGRVDWIVFRWEGVADLSGFDDPFEVWTPSPSSGDDFRIRINAGNSYTALVGRVDRAVMPETALPGNDVTGLDLPVQLFKAAITFSSLRTEDWESGAGQMITSSNPNAW